MGVPALFRWLSKKYPKIVLPVIEEESEKVADMDGKTVEIPIDMSKPNPNGEEYDNLYLDMNGIVHPCTHPEGKPAPENEEAMMVEIFNYTERIVNTIRPRKLLFLAIDGVAPRAKMNQQRSRRFRSAQEAREKEEARKENEEAWKVMTGKTVTDENPAPPFDSNSITPGTPFMDLLAVSLRYWVVSKLNNDPAWKDLEVILSDASVPGEGEHKIMDYIRRQRIYPAHNPNTSHIICGLDADLIMLSLATHEPNFKVLREDVFAQDKSNACRICGQEGHYAASCPGKAKESADPSNPIAAPAKPVEKLPFIFLDVSILREYLFTELNLPQVPFPFDFERAIDDWVLLIFFVGNDFLPHLPSLEIREGAIDTLLRIWKTELPRMGGYLTNNGRLELSRVQIMLDGLSSREDEIFKKRREAEMRQDANAKRRKLEQGQPSESPALTLPNVPPSVPSTKSPILDQNVTHVPNLPKPIHPSLPLKPSFTTFATPVTPNFSEQSAKALSGSNHDVVANRSAIRMANMSAADSLRAELAGLKPLKPKQGSSEAAAPWSATSPTIVTAPSTLVPISDTDGDIPGFGDEEPSAQSEPDPGSNLSAVEQPETTGPAEMTEEDVDPNEPPPFTMDEDESSPRGVKRKLDDDAGPAEANGAPTPLEEEAPDVAEEAVKKTFEMKVNTDGTVEQEDTVKLWEPGYRERYYTQKFGVSPQDDEFRKEVTKKYVEGLSWVLAYYYQGVPSWKWYYPYHYAPFASDFREVAQIDIQFEIGEPFRPFEQLMGVFPSDSKKQVPEVFHPLMTESDSPIIDFYPAEFQIDMNGKKMTWQGIALLPFIDESRLLTAMRPLYDKLTEEEQRRNSFSSNLLFVSGEHQLHPLLESLYTKRRLDQPLMLDAKLSRGVSGKVLPDSECVPEATYYCPLDATKIPHVDPPLVDIYNDRSLSSLYYFPEQHRPHQSILLNGYRRAPPKLTAGDHENVRRGGNRGRGGGPPNYGNHSMHMENQRFVNNERTRQPFNYNGAGRGNYGYGQGYGRQEPYSRPQHQYMDARPGSYYGPYSR